MKAIDIITNIMAQTIVYGLGACIAATLGAGIGAAIVQLFAIAVS